MKIQDTVWSVSLCLFVVQGLIQCSPVSNKLSKPTILSAMSIELSSQYGTCGFPPKDVVREIDSYEFLEPCNRRIPPPNASISDESLIRCMGLLEVGLRICSLDKKYFDNSGHLSRVNLPNNGSMFNKLLDDLSKYENKNMCSDLKKENVLGTSQYPLINGWNFIKVLEETEGSCTRICFDLKNNTNILCKLILWSSNQLMAQTILDTTVADNPLSDHSTPKISQSMPNKGVPPSASGTGTESKDLDLELESRGQQIQYSAPSTTNSGDANLNIDGGQVGIINQAAIKLEPTSMQLGSNQDKIEPNKNNQIPNNPQPSKPSDETSSTQHVVNPSPSNLQAKNDERLEEMRPMPQDTTKDDVPTKSDSTKVIDTVKPITSEQQIPKQLISGGNDKLQLPTHQKQDTSSALDQLGYKAGSINVAVSSQPVGPMEISHEHSPTNPIDKLPDVSQGENPPSNPMDRIPDISQGDDDRSFDQNQDPDDVNFDDTEQQQPELSHEPGGNLGFDSNNYKSQQEQLTHGNIYNRERFEDQEDSHFFSYFMTMVILCMVGYVVFHNKQKIMALVLEGRSRRTSRRRPTTANYHKLDNNLEEAVSSPCSTSVTHVIY